MDPLTDTPDTAQDIHNQVFVDLGESAGLAGRRRLVIRVGEGDEGGDKDLGVGRLAGWMRRGGGGCGVGGLCFGFGLGTRISRS